MKMPSVAAPQHKFSMVPQAKIERSVFDRSHPYKTTFDAGYLIPFFWDTVLPGDTMNLSVHGFCRLSTPLKPLLDNLYMETFFFFVPTRLVWANFVKFMGEQTNPGDSTSYVVPIMNPPVGGYAVGTVQDYLGIPTGVACTAASWNHQSLPIRCYYRIYNEWFRDENLVPSVALGLVTSDGPDSGATGSVLKRGKRHDYFTSCLPWPQKATTGVTVAGTISPTTTNQAPSFWNRTAGTPAGLLMRSAAGAGTAINIQLAGGGVEQLGWLDPGLSATVSINALRQSFQIQKLLERDARGGTRYTEKIKSHFGVTSPDARLQRTEYLGGGSTPVVISPVAQTAPQQAAGVTTPQGNLAGFGTAAFSGGHGFVKSFTEHGYLIGLVNVRADLTYQQGLERQWIHSTLYDHFWPALAHIGEQAVYNMEIFLADNATQNSQVFGYQERYAEYRYKPGRVTGLFRSNAAGTLHVWHLSEQFGALPTLAATFIEDQTSSILQRNLAVNTEPDFIGDFWFQYKCARPMPVYGVPGLIDHF